MWITFHFVQKLIISKIIAVLHLCLCIYCINCIWLLHYLTVLTDTLHVYAYQWILIKHQNTSYFITVKIHIWNPTLECTPISDTVIIAQTIWVQCVLKKKSVQFISDRFFSPVSFHFFFYISNRVTSPYHCSLR